MVKKITSSSFFYILLRNFFARTKKIGAKFLCKLMMHLKKMFEGAKQ